MLGLAKSGLTKCGPRAGKFGSRRINSALSRANPGSRYSIFDLAGLGRKRRKPGTRRIGLAGWAIAKLSQLPKRTNKPAQGLADVRIGIDRFSMILSLKCLPCTANYQPS
jgi:hypothetical protein